MQYSSVDAVMSVSLLSCVYIAAGSHANQRGHQITLPYEVYNYDGLVAQHHYVLLLLGY